jgi:hypothetical protein
MARYGKAIIIIAVVLTAGCTKEQGPDHTGEFKLSSQRFGVESYYIFGYRYEDSETYRYPYTGDPLPDIINEGFRVVEGTGTVTRPGFNTPGQVNGFALAGEFGSLEAARTFYSDYTEVGDDLEFNTFSDTVRNYQVWIQQTAAGNYVKLLVKDIRLFESEGEIVNSEITLEYTYQPDGSADFRD